jgi:cathepsin C
MRCGHEEPSNEETSYTAKSPLQFTKSYNLTLTDSNVAILSLDEISLKGNWTMVYDEAFSLRFDNLTFFAFSKYNKEEKQGNFFFQSQCYSTCVGWYLDQKNRWGCYQAFKRNENPNKVTYFNTKHNLNIVEPDNLVEETRTSQEIINSMLNMHFKSVKDEFSNNSRNKNLKSSNKKHKTYLDTKETNANSLKLKNFETRLQKKRKISSFLEERGQSRLRLDSSFSDHSLYITKLNSVKKSWNAALHPDFLNMSIRQLNKYAGIARLKVQKIQKNSNEDVSDFPKNFDWKEKLKTAGSQGNCGSCYVYSTIRMIQARLKIKYNHDVDLSIQHPLDCSFYNQGCNGGYPFLVMKFAKEFELIPESCKPYTVKY